MRAGSSHDFARFSVGSRPSVRAGSRHIAFGTDDPEATQHFLSIVDGDTLHKSVRGDPLMSYISVSEHLSDVKWLNSSTLLAATGSGNLKLFQFTGGEIKHVGQCR